jgi:hypothetical protein
MDPSSFIATTRHKHSIAGPCLPVLQQAPYLTDLASYAFLIVLQNKLTITPNT